MAWIKQFCRLRGHEFFCEVDREYIEDRFNLYGLFDEFENCKSLIEIILDVNLEKYLALEDNLMNHMDSQAEILYGMIHTRFITTTKGLHAMAVKFQSRDFGTCPNFYCKNTPMVPVGLKSRPGQSPVKLFCPLCERVYHPKKTRHKTVDGAFFGESFPHLFFITFPQLKPMNQSVTTYVPRIKGFRIHPQAYELSLYQKKKEEVDMDLYMEQYRDVTERMATQIEMERERAALMEQANKASVVVERYPKSRRPERSTPRRPNERERQRGHRREDHLERSRRQDDRKMHRRQDPTQDPTTLV